TSDKTVQDKLKAQFGTVDNIDPWLGGLAEDHVAGASVGPLIQRVLVDQFTRLRDGDRFWFEKTFTGFELLGLELTSLRDILLRNTTLTNLQFGTFSFKVSISGTVYNDLNANGKRDFGEYGLIGRTVQLFDDNGTLLATTTTGVGGHYKFDNSDDLGPGTFQVREVVPFGWKLTSPLPDDIEITRGMSVLGVDFGNHLGTDGPAGGGLGFDVSSLATAVPNRYARAPTQPCSST